MRPITANTARAHQHLDQGGIRNGARQWYPMKAVNLSTGPTSRPSSSANTVYSTLQSHGCDVSMTSSSTSHSRAPRLTRRRWVPTDNGAGLIIWRSRVRSISFSAAHRAIERRSIE